MASKNVETLRSVHESWNRRDFAGIVRNATEGLVYTDHARSLTLNTRDKFREWTEDWAKAFSDGRITNPITLMPGMWSLLNSLGKAWPITPEKCVEADTGTGRRLPTTRAPQQPLVCRWESRMRFPSLALH